MVNNCLISFKSNISDFELPIKFTFPFYYKPHPLCVLAAEELQENVINDTNWNHVFWKIPNSNELPIGKMFGVLLVKANDGKIGYLASFSGKIGDKNIYPNFVPPVYDMLDSDSFFLSERAGLIRLSEDIAYLENHPEYKNALLVHQNYIEQSQNDLSEMKSKLKSAKKIRDFKRKELVGTLSNDEYIKLCDELKEESLINQFHYKELGAYWKQKLSKSLSDLKFFEDKINLLKQNRKQKSIEVQEKLFKQYSFLNAKGEVKSLYQIFNLERNILPPSGAGECAAPKLLQYAYLNNLKPLALAEFWWGESPLSEIRKHKSFYPSCRGKCEPILGHMLQGLNVEENPLLINLATEKIIDIVYEDDFLLAVNKPPELLSVPGINIEDSVFSRMQQMLPDCKSPLIVHRLDMSTSGIMLIAKTKDVHQFLQAQFIKRRVKKEYVALLEGEVKLNKGKISLPLRLDVEDRPRQMVCMQHGKSAETEYEVINIMDRRTKIRFYPLTGRTHQLRVHSAHILGLNAPIVGDDLYGKVDSRLFLHAEKITFIHPVTREWLTIVVPSEF
jgi:tRNA pseudouridine32 synthase/23S rRNA pseudouridine746 synthase